MTQRAIHIGCAGAQIPKQYAEYFPQQGTHLERYAQVFNCTEINSSFYREHKPSTYAKWANEVPGHFKFAVKMPREITHNTRLNNPSLLDEFLEGPLELGGKLGPLLIQLPPNMSFDSYVAGAFFEELRGRFKGQVVCEPRHPSWFDGEVDDLFKEMRIARVAADPAPKQCDDRPGGWKRLVYYRLHGKPKKYYSHYNDDQLDEAAEQLEKAARSASTWCIFDNTAVGAGVEDALALMERVEEEVYV